MAVVLHTEEQRGTGVVEVVKPRAPHTFTVLAAALVFACCSVGAWLAFVRPNWEMYWHQVDLQVYMWGGSMAALHPELLYDGRGPLGLPFLYPVFAAWICAELARFPIDYVGTGITLLTLGALWVSVWSAGLLQQRRPGVRLVALTTAVAAAALWLEPVQQTLQFGQLSVLLMAFVLADLAIPKNRWYRGILIGLATGLKLTPAVFVVYLLITRQFRAAATACAAFAATVAIGFWYRPAQAWEFWTTTMTSQNRIGFAYVQNQSINGLFGRLQWSTWDDSTGSLVCAGLVGLAGIAAARVAYLRGDELLGALLAATVMLLASPISWTHYWVWIVPALLWIGHALRHRRRAVRIAVPALIYLFVFAWPMRVDRVGWWDPDLPLLPQGLVWYVPQTNGREFHWTLTQFLLGDSYTLLAVAALLAAIVWLYRPRGARSRVTDQGSA
ncbi:glycosyltransferase 87 family protein [Nocardia brasiliensis]|uniref:glycosyltransferase 87 family protein n=1 Tax=Nocardia brasiliensis TaxID=37326 RepID=UPI0024582D9C|nr:glycosyltransferase 87 family protein [Nocardia brasiliensis]